MLLLELTPAHGLSSQLSLGGFGLINVTQFSYFQFYSNSVLMLEGVVPE